MSSIHPTAVVHEKAELGEGVEVGPYSIIGENVRIGDRTKVMAHVYLDGHTQFHKMLKNDLDRLGKEQLGLPNFPVAWVPNSTPEQYPDWTGRWIRP